MKILMLSWEYPPRIVGGISRVVHDLSHKLVKDGHDVTVVTYRDGDVPYIENEADFTDMEVEDDMVVVYGTPTNWYQIKEAISKVKNDIEFEIDEVSYIPKEKITLSAEDREIFDRDLKLLDDVEDVQNVYHNVEL